ncbi:hypothetical protein AM228_01715 [Planktothricoides sp. SR001]|nr:hypothetical protein AM228_01715 [Planktothricoides sp. SR001]
MKNFINKIDQLALNIIRVYVLDYKRQNFWQIYENIFYFFDFSDINSLCLASNYARFTPEVKSLLKQFIDETEIFFNQCEDIN